jgi:hypothetical protein
MRPLATLATAAFLLAANTGCAAAGAGTPAFDLHGDEFDRVRGEYALVDGRVAHIAGTRRHPRLEMADGGSLALRALSAFEFVSDDGCARVTFETNANASVTRVRIARAAGCAAR